MTRICREAGAKTATRVKSMLGEEIGIGEQGHVQVGRAELMGAVAGRRGNELESVVHDAVGLDDPEGHEQAGDRRPVVNAAERVRCLREALRRVDVYVVA